MQATHSEWAERLAYHVAPNRSLQVACTTVRAEARMTATQDRHTLIHYRPLARMRKSIDRLRADR